MTANNRQRWIMRAITVVSAVVVLSPIAQNWRDDLRDSFPLSHYPMFSDDRGDHHTVTYLLGVEHDGEREHLPYRLVGAGGLNQVRKQIRNMVREGHADELCQVVAAGLAKRNRARLADVHTVQVVTGTYDLNLYSSGVRTPVKEVIRASCEAPRRLP